MEKVNGQEHVMLTEMDCAKECNLNFKVETGDILQDIKFLMREYYVATFTTHGNELRISFNNGQSFLLKVDTCA